MGKLACSRCGNTDGPLTPNMAGFLLFLRYPVVCPACKEFMAKAFDLRETLDALAGREQCLAVKYQREEA